MPPNRPPTNLTTIRESNPIDEFVREMEGAAAQMQTMLNDVRTNSGVELAGMAKDFEHISELVKDLHATMRGNGLNPGLLERVAIMEERLNHARQSVANITEEDKKEKSTHIQGGYGMKIAMIGSFTSLMGTIIMIILQIVLKK